MSARLRLLIWPTFEDTLWVTSPSGADAPKFAILDVVTSRLPEEEGQRGVVSEVRRYEGGRYRYGVDGWSADVEIGGIYDESDLEATGDKVTIDHFWRGTLRAREIVRVAETHPRPELRGRYAEVQYEIVPDSQYTVSVPKPRKRGPGIKLRYKDVLFEHLVRTGERMPPEPVPRPATTWISDEEDRFNPRPWHAFDILDEIEQYL